MGLDADRVRICRIALPPLEPTGTAIAVGKVRAVERGVRIEYRATPPAGGAALDRFAECRFSLGRRADLEGITTDRGEVPGATVFLLKRYYVETPEGAAADPGPPPDGVSDVPAWLAPAAQHLLAGSVGAVATGLLAAAYGLLFGLLGRINLVLGPVAALGAAATGVVVAGGTSLAGLAAGLLAGTAAAALWTAATGWAALLSIPPARAQSRLVATVGFVLALPEFLRLAVGPGWPWLPPLGHAPIVLARSDSGTVSVTSDALLTLAIGTAALLAVSVAMVRSRFGRRWRAGSDDALAAALLGVDPRRLAASTLAISGALAGLSGALLALRFGALGFADGLDLGLKALAGTILGGIGSVPGAAAGGLAVGLFQSLWPIAFPVEGRDLALFVGLVSLIMLKPAGLFARA